MNILEKKVKLRSVSMEALSTGHQSKNEGSKLFMDKFDRNRDRVDKRDQNRRRSFIRVTSSSHNKQKSRKSLINVTIKNQKKVLDSFQQKQNCSMNTLTKLNDFNSLKNPIRNYESLNANSQKNKKKIYIMTHKSKTIVPTRVQKTIAPVDYLIRMELEDVKQDQDEMGNPFIF